MKARKKAMVTGASEGIGRIFALRLAELDYSVTVIARSEARLQQLVVEMGEGEHSYRAVDLSTEGGVAGISEELKSSRYQLLVNNAGISTSGYFTEQSLVDQLPLIRLNCECLTVLAHSFLGAAEKGDALVNVASLVGFFPYTTQTVYSATKAFVLSLTEGLWVEQKERDVFVMAICPGPTATGFFDRAGMDAGAPKGITQTPEKVVEKALRALDKRASPTHISGALNTVLANIPRILTRRAAVSALGGK